MNRFASAEIHTGPINVDTKPIAETLQNLNVHAGTLASGQNTVLRELAQAIGALSMDVDVHPIVQALDRNTTALTAAMEQVSTLQTSLDNIAETLAAPKKVVRDELGNITGVR